MYTVREIADLSSGPSSMTDIWLDEASDAVGNMVFNEGVPLTEASWATLIAAYMQASATAAVALHTRELARNVDRLASRFDGLGEMLRSDHPLQGETLGGVTSALEHIAENLNGVSASDADGFIVTAMGDIARSIASLRDPL